MTARISIGDVRGERWSHGTSLGCGWGLVLQHPELGTGTSKLIFWAPRAGRLGWSILGPAGIASCRAGMLLALFVLAPPGFFLHESCL